MQKLNGQVSIVTGGATGLGEACAAALAQHGSRVVVVDRDADALARMRKTLEGQLAMTLSCDVSSAAEVTACHGLIESKIGPADLLVNCAGINARDRHFEQLSAKDWDQVIGVNLSGTYYWCQAVLGNMRRRRQGTIINVSSWAGRQAAFFTGPAYNASKRAVIALTESINLEEAHHNVRATALVPEAMATEMIRRSPMRPSDDELDRMLQPQDVANLVAHVATLPAHVCINELVVSPTFNRSILGGYDTALTRQGAAKPR